MSGLMILKRSSVLEERHQLKKVIS